jgi:hypothetical protein
VHAAIVGVEEVAAIRNRMMMRSADRTAGPTAAARSTPAAAMLAGFFAEFDAVLHLILDASKTSWNQPTISLELFFAHNLFDAQTGRKVRQESADPPVGYYDFWYEPPYSTTTIAQKTLEAKSRFQTGQTAKLR